MPVDAELAAEMETAVDEVVKEAADVTAEEVAAEKTTTGEVKREEEVKKEITTEGEVVTVIPGEADAVAPTEDTQEVDTEETTPDKETTDVRTTDEDSDKDPEGVPPEEGSKLAGKEEITPPQISDEVLTRAAQVGIPVEVARTFPSEVTLQAWIADRERTATTDTTDKTKTETKDPLDELPKLDPEVYEPEVIAVVDKLTNAIRQQRDQIKELSDTAQNSTEVTQGEAVREMEQWFDGQIEKLGDDFTEALGKGGHQSLNRGSPQYAKREELATQVGVLVSGYQASGLEPPPRDEVFQAAAKLTLGNEFQKVHKRQLTKELKKQGSQHISRAGGQTATSKQSAEEEIAAKIDEKYFKS